MEPHLIRNIEKNFADHFDTVPLLIFSPGRINLIGEHVDYNGGYVLPAAIDKGIVVALERAEPTAKGRCTALAVDYGEFFQFELSDLEPIQDGGWRNYLIGVVAELQKLGCEVGPFNTVFGGNIPAGGGLSSSAALENGIVFGLDALFGLGLQKEQMIRISQNAEHHYVGVQCGIMDQYASMFGVPGHFLLLDCRTLESRTVWSDLTGHRMILINSKVHHSLADSTYNDRRALCERVATLLGKRALRDTTAEELRSLKDQGLLMEEDFRKVSFVVEEMQRTLEAARAVEANDLPALGRLLFETHDGLSTQYEVSCQELDFLVEQARATEGVLGARMMGGGFGGCTLNLLREEAVESFIAKTCKAYEQTFGFSCEPLQVTLSQGTHLIPQI